MKQKHRLTALLTSLCLLLSMLPISSLPVLAANGTLEGDGTEESPYQIADGDDLKAFRDLVNGGGNDAWAVLTADIVLNEDLDQDKFAVDVDDNLTYDGNAVIPDFEQWTPIGRYNTVTDYLAYTGTFDGQGHTISGLYINIDEDDVSSNQNFGLFSYLGSGGVIQNLGLVNSLVRTDERNVSVAGVVARLDGAVQNCYNAGTVSGLTTVGGVVGSNNIGAIENCYNTGTVSSVYANAGGVVGDNNSGAIENCYNTGTVSSDSGNAGGVVGNNNNGTTIKNCYNTGAVSSVYANAGGVVGSNNEFNKTIIENCYYLNTSASAGIGSGSGFAVSKIEEEMKSSGFLTQLNGGQDPAPFRADFNTLGGYLNGGYPILSWQNPFAGGSGVEGDPFLIVTKEQLEAFRDYVNDGRNGIWGKLEADIDLNPGYTFHEDGSYTYSGEGEAPKVQSWTPIGSSSHRYTGTFDGGGCTISGVYINNASNNQGLFGYVGSGDTAGAVQNLGVVNSCIRGASYVGGVVGSVNGSGRIQNCYNTGSVYGRASSVGGVAGSIDVGSVSACYNTGSVSGGASYVGGVVGYVEYSASITNCYNTGSVTGAYINIGGVAGYVYHSSTVTNCYNTGSVSGESSVGGVTGYVYNSSTVRNCYYLDTSASTGIDYGSGEATSLTAEQMTGSDALGEGETQMNLNTTVWTAGSDAPSWEHLGENDNGNPVYGLMGQLPQLTVFANAGNGHEEIPVQTVDGLQQETDPEDGKTYYLIYDKDDLELFRDIVNGNLTEVQKLLYPEGASANGKLEADIVLNEDFDQELFAVDADGNLTYNGGEVPSTFEQWEPIGSGSYAGTFDGDYHTVSGVYINNDSRYQSLFGWVDSGGTIQNLGVVNSYISAYYASGVVSLSYGPIQNCYNAGNINASSDGAYAGGVVALSRGSVQNCYNTGSVSASGDHAYVGGVVALSYGSVQNCYNTGNINASGNNAYVGGMVGFESNDVNVQNCYNAGSINASGDDAYAGGVVGFQSHNGSTQNCYFLEGTAGIGHELGTVDSVTSLTAEQMTGPGALDSMSALDSSLWTAGGEAGTEWIYLGANPDNTGSYGVMGYLPQLTVFANAGKGHEEIPLETIAGLQQEAGSDGTTYYLIYTADQLKTFRDIVNNTLTGDDAALYTADAAANGRLEADIVLNEDFDQTLFGEDADGNVTYNGNTDIPDFEQWTPIGNNSRPYTGTFDGGGHTVSGVYINTPNVSDQGLFGYVGSSSTAGTVQNLGVVNSYIRGNSVVGGVVSQVYASQSSVTNCYNTGTVCGTGASVGGVVGQVYGGSVSVCYNTGSVNSGASYVGGVVGSNDGTVQSCYNTGSVTGVFHYVGGVVGSNGGAVQSCYNTGMVTGGEYYIGGVAGDVSTDGNVTNCYYLNTSASAGIGGGTGKATSLTAAQMEDAGENGLLALLSDNIPTDQENPWNTTLSAVGAWEYGKPAVQPVFTWQTVVVNVPTYFVTIPEKAEVGGEASISITSAGALRADQQVEISVAENTVFNLYYGGDVNDDAIAYQIFADGSKTALEAGGAVLTSGNTAEEAPSKADLTFAVADTPKYSGTYTGTLIFTVSVEEVTNQ